MPLSSTSTSGYIFLDAVNRLPEALAETIDDEIALFEEAPMAELLTRWERRGWRQGKVEGREEGMVEGISATITRHLSRKQITLDAATEGRIRSLDSDTLLTLVDALFDFQTRADLDAWLAQAATKE